jgi:hypothetical protein
MLDEEFAETLIYEERQRVVTDNMVGEVDLLEPKWIVKVAETTDNELRGHRVALTYSRLALELDDLIHGESSYRRLARKRATGPANANFFHFATWGTLTVTQNIITDRPPQRLNVGWPIFLRRALTPIVLRARASDAQIVGRALAWGQRLIFVSACLALINFKEQLDNDGTFSRDTLEQTVDHELIRRLTSSATRRWFNQQRHSVPIGLAFERYFLARQAFLEGRSGESARLVLGANLLLTAVEQDLVDRALSFVVDLVPRRVDSAIDWRMAKLAEKSRGIPAQVSYTVLQSRHERLRRALDTVWSRFMTDQVLVMALPTETLRLGRDIPPWRRDRPYFPIDLRNLADVGGAGEQFAGAIEDVARYVASLDRTTGDGRGSAARDWRRWDERMNWAVTLMRSRQRDETLFWRPYSETDEQRIVLGEHPDRGGDPSALCVQAPLDSSVYENADLRSRREL